MKTMRQVWPRDEKHTTVYIPYNYEFPRYLLRVLSDGVNDIRLVFRILKQMFTICMSKGEYLGNEEIDYVGKR